MREHLQRDGAERRANTPAPDQAHGPRGFTFAETLVAVTLSATLLAALVPVYFNAVTNTLAAHQQSMATMLAAARLEQLRGLAFSFEDAGSQGLLRLTDTTTEVTADSPTPGGAGLTPSPSGALLIDTDGFVDYLDASGRVVGTSSPAPVGSEYVRRWAITPVPASPDDALVLQVMVASLHAERRQGPRLDATRRPGDAWLTLLRVRLP